MDWEKEEKYFSSKLGGKVQVRSGGGLYDKGDVKTDKFLVEVKSTDKHSYSLSSDLFNKIKSQAFGESRVPMLGISIKNKRDGTRQRFVVMEINDFTNLLEEK